MKSNVRNIDRAIGLFPALVIGVVDFYYESWWGLMAMATLVTGLASFCMFYTNLGLNTYFVKSVQ